MAKALEEAVKQLKRDPDDGQVRLNVFRREGSVPDNLVYATHPS